MARCDNMARVNLSRTGGKGQKIGPFAPCPMARILLIFRAQGTAPYEGLSPLSRGKNERQATQGGAGAP